MDPTKTMSYRRWRIKLAEKGISNIIQAMDESFKENPQVANHPDSQPDRFRAQDKIRLHFSAFDDRLNEADTQKLLKQLEKEYRKTSVFRKEKVAQLKKLIKNGLYHVPGRAVVEKWFPEDPEKETR